MKIPVFVAFLAICLSGCATAPVSQQTQRDYDGFSIVPPQEPGWVAASSGKRSVRFQKKSDSNTHIMYVGVERRIPPKAFLSKEEFLQHVNDSYYVLDPHFYEFLLKETKLNPKHGEYCVESRYKYKDYKSQRPKSASFLLEEGHCFICLHPNAKDRRYDVCYSEIFAPGEEDSQFRVAGDAFINGIQFTEPAAAKSGDKNDFFSISPELVDSKNRIYYVSTYSNPIYRVKVELDGEVVSMLSSEEVATVKCTPGPHTIKAHFGLFGDEGEKSFNLIQDGANYFIFRSTLGLGKGVVEILEVPAADWKYIAVDPFNRGSLLAYPGR